MHVADDHQAPVHQHWLTRSRLLAANGAFAVYATVLAVTTGHADRTWAIWAAAGYGVTTLILWLTRNTRVPVFVPLLVSLAGAMAAPVIWLATRVAPTAEVRVISQSALQLLHHGTPYLPQAELTSWLSYNPYLPVMAVFGMPKALGATGLLADPRVWLSVASVALIWAAFGVVAPHRHCDACRRNVWLSTVFSAACPAIAFPLALGITDPPLIALMFLTLALIARPSGVVRAAVTLGIACAMKATAWAAIPVLAVMVSAREAARNAWRFVGVAIVAAGVLSAAMAPAALADPSSFVQNTVLFPLGLTRYKTPAASPLPGHLLAATGMAGHWAAVGLLLAAGLGFAISLVVRPPADTRAAAWRLAVALAVMFTLAPATRWGYFVYPIALAGWLVLTKPPTPAPGSAAAVEVPAQAHDEHPLTVTAR